MVGRLTQSVGGSLTASAPKSDLNDLWLQHQSHCKAVDEISAKANDQMRALMTTLKGYRLHKKRCSTEIELDHGILAELLIHLEITVQDY